MNLSGLFGSYPGMYVSQSFLHLLISAVIADGAIRAWKITNPLVTQRFRFLVILFPVFSFPLYQLVNPERGSLFFRHAALFDSDRWLHFAIWGKVPLGFLFIFILFFTSVIFLVQELLPVLMDTLKSGRGSIGDINFCSNSHVVQTLSRLPGEKPEVLVLDDDERVIFSTTGRKAEVYLSSGLVKTLSADQMQAAVAHEMAHIERSRRPILFAVFLLRAAMFFNPLVLIQFRRATQDEEKICDDMAVSLTGKPYVLAQTLRRLYGGAGEGRAPQIREISRLRYSLEEYSHLTHIRSRIERLEKPAAKRGEYEWFIFTLAFAAVVVINYFVV